MKNWYSILPMSLAILAAGCDKVATGPDALAPSNAPVEARMQKRQQALAIPVVGTVDGGTFAGTATITGFALNAAGDLVATGTLVGSTTVGGVVTAVTQVFTTLADLSSSTPGACDILFLDLGPISLDLLGLTVDLSQVVLDVNAVPGAGNLLGNLLCAVVSLLDGPGAVAGLLNLLDLINDILA